MEDTVNNTPHVSHHLLYALATENTPSLIEQAIEDMERLLTEEHEPEPLEPLSVEVLALLEQEEQENLEASLKKAKFHWHVLPGAYHQVSSLQYSYKDGSSYDPLGAFDYSDAHSLPESQQDYVESFQFSEGLAETVAEFEDMSYKLTKEVLGERFADMTRTRIKELER